MPSQVRVFYAYPSDPPSIGETISSALSKLNEISDIKRNSVRFTKWTDNPVSGSRLIKTILGQVDRSQIFSCDLTYPNPNVSFELGYAIARYKRIFTTLNPGIADADKDYKRIYFSSLNMGYAGYDNHETLADRFLSEKPWQSLDQTLLDRRFRQQVPRPENPTVMYLKPPSNTDSVLATMEEIRKSIFADSIIIDDPNEYSSQMLDWYAEKLLIADAIVVHLLSTEHADHRDHNLKASIIAGLAQGFGRPMIMLAHAPYESPVDYDQWLKLHDTAESCVTATKSWLESVNESLSHRRPRRQQAVRSTSARIDLRSLFLGDPVAEHEADRLFEYFVETSSYYQALEGPLTILVGRRGTGKTAILYAIRSEMSKSREDHVTVIKPIGYETHGLIRVLDDVRHRSERGFLIESLWKYLIYSEIATSVLTEIVSRPIFHVRTPDENAFLDYYERNSRVLSPPFSERIDNAVASLEGVGDIGQASEQRLKISENLHNAMINDLRRHLGIVLASKKSLTLLIDGLDEPWGPGEHIGHLAELIAGLLGVSQFIPVDFRRSDDRVKPVETTITVLLRSDIFAFIQHLLPEQDKLPIVQVTWNDQELLLRVLEERMLYAAPRERTATAVWEDIFPDSVVGLASQDFILRTALPRPRDLIHLVKAAVSIAINRGHDKVLPNDLLDARIQYSQYAFNSILKEDDPVKGKLEAVLYEFAGTGRLLLKEDIESLFATAGVASDDSNFYFNLLCDIDFLGIETANGFHYSRDEEERRTLRNIARVIAARKGRSEMFEVNPAFYQVLQIE